MAETYLSKSQGRSHDDKAAAGTKSATKNMNERKYEKIVPTTFNIVSTHKKMCQQQNAQRGTVWPMFTFHFGNFGWEAVQVNYYF